MVEYITVSLIKHIIITSTFSYKLLPHYHIFNTNKRNQFPFLGG